MVDFAVFRCRDAPSETIERQEAALAVVMAVTAIDVFLNLYIRVVVEEADFLRHKKYVTESLDRKISLDEKMKKWPTKVLGVHLGGENDAVREMYRLKALRNHIVHFTSSHETVSFGGIEIHGLADTSDYDSLSYQTAKWAIETARNYAVQIFLGKGVPKEHIKNMLHGWCGVII